MHKLSIIIVLSILLSACASHYGAAKIISSPAGAEVISDKDGSVLGVTPMTAWWKDSSDNRQHLILRFKKNGYYEKVSSFWLSMRHKNQDLAQKNPQLVEVVLQEKTE